MTEAERMSELGRVLERIYGHLSDKELREFHQRGFIPHTIYVFLRAVRGL